MMMKILLLLGQLEWLWGCVDKDLEARLNTKGLDRGTEKDISVIYVAWKKECFIKRGNLTIDGECRMLKIQNLEIRDRITNITEKVDEMGDTEETNYGKIILNITLLKHI